MSMYSTRPCPRLSRPLRIVHPSGKRPLCKQEHRFASLGRLGPRCRWPRLPPRTQRQVAKPMPVPRIGAAPRSPEGPKGSREANFARSANSTGLVGQLRAPGSVLRSPNTRVAKSPRAHQMCVAKSCTIIVSQTRPPLHCHFGDTNFLLCDPSSPSRRPSAHICVENHTRAFASSMASRRRAALATARRPPPKVRNF